jgi:hypothetical protein
VHDQGLEAEHGLGVLRPEQVISGHAVQSREQDHTVDARFDLPALDAPEGR